MPAPDFEVEIDAMLVIEIPTADGYTNATRTVVSNFLVTKIVPLVDPNSIIMDYTKGINDAIASQTSNPNYAGAIDPWKSKLKELCYITINTIVIPAYSGGQPSPNVRVHKVVLTQSSTANPVASVKDNTLADATPTWTRTGAGVSRLTATASFGTADTDIMVFLSLGQNEFLQWSYKWQDTNTVDITTYSGEVDPDTGAITWTPVDDILDKTPVSIEVYPTVP